MGKLSRGVSIIGIGFTPLGRVNETPELMGFTERELVSMAAMEAMEDGNISAQDIDVFYLGMSGPNFSSKIKSAAPHFSEWLGMQYKPGIFHDEGCGSQAAGLADAVAAVSSGLYDVALTVGLNINSCIVRDAGLPLHMRSERSHDSLMDAVYAGLDSTYEKVGMPGVLDAMAVAYCNKYGVSFHDIDEALTSYMIHQREQVRLNPKALLVTEGYEEEAKRFGFDDVHAYLTDKRYSPMMGSVIRGRHLGTNCDGASAAIVCRTEDAHKYVSKPVEVAGISTVCAPQRGFVEYPIPPLVKAFEDAYEMADITDPASQIDQMQIMDAPPTSVLVGAEIGGFIEPGEAWRYMRDWRIGIDGEKPINTNGGLCQHGHALAPSWMTQVAEIVAQMRGEAGDRQQKEAPKTGVVYGGGGGFNLGVGVFRAGW